MGIDIDDIDRGAIDGQTTLSVVSPDWLDSNRAAIVDVRPARESSQVGHVPDAVNIPFEIFRDPGGISAGMLPEPDQFQRLLGEAGIAPGDPIRDDEQCGVYAARFLLTAAVLGHEGPLFLLDGAPRELATVPPNGDRNAGRPLADTCVLAKLDEWNSHRARDHLPRSYDPEKPIGISYTEHRRSDTGTDREPELLNPARVHQYEGWC